MLALLELAEVRVQPSTGDFPSVIVIAKLAARKVQVSARASITMVLHCLHLVNCRQLEPYGGRSFTALHPVQ